MKTLTKVISTVLLCFLPFTFAKADGALFVFDGSGSMWGQN